ncbi:hypothetical protein AZE42_09677 [Rhizopogon vesiculosus]|uniref:Uncharacterized protein n=1 Tax=Rhizopogon vesiculosus TaxID=180088 RepID=A0A1J8QD68_9AGAM|nr:hypothetical protein AZE42_09677 [Rhizopogon vesiculosus]
MGVAQGTLCKRAKVLDS